MSERSYTLTTDPIPLILVSMLLLKHRDSRPTRDTILGFFAFFFGQINMLKKTIRLSMALLFASAIVISFVFSSLSASDWLTPLGSVSPSVEKHLNGIIEFSNYIFQVVPSLLVGYLLLLNNIDQSSSPILFTAIRVGVWGLLVPTLIGVTAVWSDTILKRIPPRASVFFLILFLILFSTIHHFAREQVSRLVIIYSFAQPLKDHLMEIDIPRFLIIGAILITNLGYLGLWEFFARSTVRRNSSDELTEPHLLENDRRL